MKKIIYVLLATTLMLGASDKQANASAFNMGITYTIASQISSAVNNFRADEELNPAKESTVQQRIQFFWNWKASDKLETVIIARTPGEMVWGNQSDSITTKGFDGGTYLALKVASIDWVFAENLRFRFGRQFYRTPGYLGLGGAGSPMHGEYFDGARMFGSLADNLGIDFVWLRPHSYRIATAHLGTTNAIPDNLVYMAQAKNSTQVFDSYQATTFTELTHMNDTFVLALPVSSSLVDVTPWGGFSFVGKDVAMANSQPYNANFINYTGDMTYLYWAGFISKVKMDNLTFGVDGLYSGTMVDYHKGGFLVDGYARYIFSHFSLGVVGWYANGNSEDAMGGIISARDDGGWPVENTAYFSRGLAPSVVACGPATPIGTTGAGLELRNFKPIASLPMTIGANVTYIHGTNHENYKDSHVIDENNAWVENTKLYNIDGNFANYLTTKDHVIDLGATIRYIASGKLSLGLEYNYLMPHFGREGAAETRNGQRLGFVAILGLQ